MTFNPIHVKLFHTKNSENRAHFFHPSKKKYLFAHAIILFLLCLFRVRCDCLSLDEADSCPPGSYRSPPHRELGSSHSLCSSVFFKIRNPSRPAPSRPKPWPTLLAISRLVSTLKSSRIHRIPVCN